MGKCLKILLIGYGKMGKAIHEIALKRGHIIANTIDVHNSHDLKNYNSTNVHVAIEFSTPASAFDNVCYCLQNRIPVVCGTTGWLDKMPQIEEFLQKNNVSFCYSSNYSVGVNIFFALNKYLAKLMSPHSLYDPTVEETHHIYKKDAPSGTAITLAHGILENLPRKKSWTGNLADTSPDTLYIAHKREHNEPGIHTVKYTSSIDSITINHTAYSREGFATGAVLAAEYIHDKTSNQIINMTNVLNLDNL